MKNRQKYCFLILIMCFFGCTTETDNDAENDDWKVYYFDFDQVDHFNINITEADALELETKKQSQNENLLVSVLTGDKPLTLSDSAFLYKLTKLGFEQNEISQAKHPLIHELFREKSADPNNLWSTCLPVYRDILVFRKDKKIVGIVKICFECDEIQIIGTAANTDNFRSNKGFSKLWKILYT